MNDSTATNIAANAAGVPALVPPPPTQQSVHQSEKFGQQSGQQPSQPSPSKDVTVSQTDHSDRPSLQRYSQAQACLISTILHLIAILTFALTTYGISRVSSTMISLRGEQVGATAEVVLEISPDQSELTNEPSPQADEPVDVTLSLNNAAAIESPAIRDMASIAIDNSDLGQITAGATATSTAQLKRLPGGGLSGRTPQRKKELGAKYGATAQSEAAVDMALQWMAQHQRADGSWSFNLKLAPCNGRCSHSKKSSDSPTPATGATGLVLLAFLGAGHTHHEGDYQETVRKGLYYLRNIADESSLGLDWQRGSMYGHGIALMALGEALTMTRIDNQYDSDLMELVRGGSVFTCIAQHPNGSWGYVPGSPGDTTLSGWQVMSLLAARRNGIYLRTHTLPRAKQFLLSVKTDDWQFGYKTPEGEPTMDAIALTLLLYLGHSPGHTLFDRAVDRIADRGPTLTNVYHDYYASLALHHSRHPDWDQFNRKLRDHLVLSQATQGHERGSWHFKDKWGDVGGRLYTTAMSTMILEIYYRYLPLYGEIEDFPL